MPQAIVAFVATLLQPLFYVALSAALVALVPWIRRHVRSGVLASALSSLASLAATCVAHAEQTVVRGLKDPAQPGVWDATTQAAVKASVLADLRAYAAGPLKDLARSGLSSAQITTVLDRHIEQAVHDMQSFEESAGDMVTATKELFGTLSQRSAALDASLGSSLPSLPTHPLTFGMPGEGGGAVEGSSGGPASPLEGRADSTGAGGALGLLLVLALSFGTSQVACSAPQRPRTWTENAHLTVNLAAHGVSLADHLVAADYRAHAPEAGDLAAFDATFAARREALVASRAALLLAESALDGYEATPTPESRCRAVLLAHDAAAETSRLAGMLAGEIPGDLTTGSRDLDRLDAPECAAIDGGLERLLVSDAAGVS